MTVFSFEVILLMSLSALFSENSIPFLTLCHDKIYIISRLPEPVVSFLHLVTLTYTLNLNLEHGAF